MRPTTYTRFVALTPVRLCLICGTGTHGYGTWKDGVTCSRKCEDAKRQNETILTKGNFNGGTYHVGAN